MRGYTVFVLATAAFAGFLSLPFEIARQLLGYRGAGVPADVTGAESSL